jgi:hypothetical protein
MAIPSMAVSVQILSFRVSTPVLKVEDQAGDRKTRTLTIISNLVLFVCAFTPQNFVEAYGDFVER